MKTKTKGVTRKILSGALALSLSASMAILPLTTSMTADAGTVINIVTGKWAAIGLEYFERATMRVLGAAASHAENDTVAKILTTTKRFLGNPMSNTLGDIKKMCAEMNAKLDAISKKIDENQKVLVQKLNGIAGDIKENAFKDKKAQLDTINSHNTYIIGLFDDFCAKAQEADINDKASINELSLAYESLIKIYESPNGITTRTTITFNYADDAQTIAKLISTYSPTYELQSNIKNNVDVGDKKGWGDKNSTDTLITNYYDLLPYSDAFDHEYYRDMTAQYNYALGIAANYMESYNLYVSYAAQLIYAGAIDGLDTNERSKQMTVDSLWKDYDECCYIVMRALAQMVDEYDSKLSGIMRGYDVNTSIHFDNIRESIKGSQRSGGYINDEQTSNRNKTSNRMQVYQMRPFGSTTAYALRKTNGSQPAVKMEDLSYYAFDYRVEVFPWYQHECNGYTCDYYNLFMSAATSPTGWNPLKKSDQLNGLVNTIAFENLGAGSDSDIIKYLKAHGMSSDLPKIDGSNPYTPSTNYEWNYDTGGHIGNWDIDMKFYNVAGIKKGSAMGEQTYDMDDDEDDFKGKETSIFYTGDPQVAVYLPSNSGAQYQYSAVDYKGAAASANGGRNVFRSGGTITLRVKPDEGKYIKSLRLCDRFVYDEDHAKGTLTQYISENDMLYRSDCGIYPESDGYYTFRINVPFRDGSVILDLGDVPTNTHTVELVESKPVVNSAGSYDLDSGILSFADFTGEKEINVNTGDTVSVAVIPYTKYMCTGIEVRDQNGKLYEYMEIDPSDYYSIVHGQKNFSFVVPDADITVKAIYGDSYNVELVSDEHSSLKFINDIGTVDENDDIRSFNPGETVKLRTESSSGYSLSGITVSDYTNRENIPCRINDSDISFTMPEGNVVVESVSEKMDMNKYVASVNKRDLSRISLVDSTGSSLNVSSVQVAPGDMVYFKSSAGEPIVKDKNDNAVQYENTNGMYTFEMPESNTEISSVVYSATITDGSVLKFLDEYGNAVDETQVYYAQSEQVRLILDTENPCNYTVSAKNVSSDNVDITSQADGSFILTMPSSDVTITPTYSETVNHNYINGICRRCGHYETPTISQEANFEFGFYRIRNAGNLLWFASMFNDTNHDKADYTRGQSQGVWNGAYIYNDIDMENIPMEPIGTPELPFNGQISAHRHTIRNLNLSCSAGDKEKYVGLVGVGNGCQIYDLNIQGSAELSAPAEGGSIKYGSVIGKMDKCDIENVFSSIDVNIMTGRVSAAGIVCESVCTDTTKKSSVRGCVNFGSIKGFGEKMAGICINASNTAINNSANIGDITASDKNSVISGVAIDVSDKQADDSTRSYVNNVYNYGKLFSDDPSHVTTIIRSPGSGVSVSNNYHLEGTESSRSTAMSADQFRSGEVAYKLNGGAESGGFLFRQNIDNGKTPGEYPLPDGESGIVYYVTKEDRYSNTKEVIPVSQRTLSIDSNQFIYASNGAQICGVCFLKNGMPEPLAFNEGSVAFIYYYTDDQHHLESVKAVGKTTGNVTNIPVKAQMPFEVGGEDVEFVPHFVPNESGKVDVTICRNDLVYDSNRNPLCNLVFSDTGENGTKTVSKNTTVSLSYTVDSSYYLESLKAICLESGRTDDIPFSNGSASYNVGEESVRIVPVFKQVIPTTVEVSIDKESFVYDDNANLTSYVTFTDTGSSEPCTVDKNSDISLSYTEGKGYTLVKLVAVGQTSGLYTEVPFKDGSAVYHVGEEAVVFVPTFEKVIPDTVKLTFDTEKFIYNDSGSAVAYLTFGDTNSYDPYNAKPGSDVMIKLHNSSSYELVSLTAVGQNTGKTEEVPVSDDSIVYKIWDEDIQFVPEFVEPTVDSQPVNVSIDTDSFIYDENGAPKAYLTFGDTDSFEPITVDPDTEVTLTVHKGGCEFYSLMAQGLSSGDLRYVPIDEDTIVYQVWDEDVKFIPEFAEPEQPDDEHEEVGIRTYEELVQFAEKVQSDNDVYGNANVWLENNIIAPEDSTWTLPIGTPSNTFDGTFDGRGFGIVGLNVSVDDFGGLFGYIGSNGLVKDLAVIDCDFEKRSNCAGGIAAVNNGTIDHCLSGVNIDSSVVLYGKNGKKIRPSQYNSFIEGKYAGGIAGSNNGTITGTRNGAVVYGEICGGICAGSYGTIYGSTNNGAVGRDSVSVKVCGGLVGVNYGVIESSYNSGKPTISAAEGVSAVAGMIAALNNTDTISNTFCNYINAVPAIGGEEFNDPTGKVTVMRNTEMLEPSFADILNSVTNETVRWEQKIVNGTYLNSLYPVVLGNFLKDRTLSLSNGITLRGLMHSQLNVSYDEVEDDSEVYNVFSSALPDRQLIVYNANCDDGNGGFVSQDYWCSGVNISVPVDGDDISFAVMGSDGSIQFVEPESIENGIATFSAASPVSFAVVSAAAAEPVDEESSSEPENEDSSQPESSGSNTSSGSNSSGTAQYSGKSGDSVQTGEGQTALAAIVAMLLSAAVVVFVRRKKDRE